VNSVYKVSIDKKKDFVLVAGNMPAAISGRRVSPFSAARATEGGKHLPSSVSLN
jgi:hypothetical protein